MGPADDHGHGGHDHDHHHGHVRGQQVGMVEGAAHVHPPTAAGGGGGNTAGGGGGTTAGGGGGNIPPRQQQQSVGVGVHHPSTNRIAMYDGKVKHYSPN